MKYVLITIFLSAHFISCNKEDAFVPIYEPGSMEYGYATAFKNGKAFTASAVGFKNPRFYADSHFIINFKTESTYGELREQISIAFLRKEKSDYTATAGPKWDPADPDALNCSYFTWQSDGDVVEDDYWVDTTYPNRITIEEVDSTTWLVKGTFDLSFNVQQPKVKQYNPDNVKFTQGRFEIRIRD